MQEMNSSYPAEFSFDAPQKVANWRPIANWLLAIPHLVILYGLRILAEVVGIISWFVILFTGELPESFANIQAMYMRYELRTYTYYFFMCEEYPPFAFGMTPTDSGEDPRVRVEFRPQLTDRNRLTVAFRILLVIPHVIVLAVLELVATGHDRDRHLRRALHRSVARRDASLRPQCDALVSACSDLLFATHGRISAI